MNSFLFNKGIPHSISHSGFPNMIRDTDFHCTTDTDIVFIHHTDEWKEPLQGTETQCLAPVSGIMKNPSRSEFQNAYKAFIYFYIFYIFLKAVLLGVGGGLQITHLRLIWNNSFISSLELAANWKKKNIHHTAKWLRVLWFITPLLSFVSFCLNSRSLLDTHCLFYVSSSLRKEKVCSFIEWPKIELYWVALLRICLEQIFQQVNKHEGRKEMMQNNKKSYTFFLLI